MPCRFSLFLLCALLALPAPLPWGQAIDLQAALTGTQYPLTLKPKDLDPGWRQVSLNGPTPSGIALPQGVSTPLLNTSSPGTIYFTKGRTVTAGSETFLVAYLIPIRYEMLPYPNERTALGAASAGKSLSEGYVTYKLSLLNVRQIASLDKQALLPYIKSDDVFQYPRTHEPYLPNTSLSSRPLASFQNPAAMVIYYEAAPAPDGTRTVVFLDGHARRTPEAEWPALRVASHIPNVPPR